MKTPLIVIVLVVGGLLLCSGVSAQVSIGVSPLTFELTGNPGDVIINQVKIANNSTNTGVSIVMEAEDMLPSGEVGHVKLEPPDEERTYSLARWIKAEPGEFDLGPKEGKWVQFTVTIPEDGEPGGHYGAVLARTKTIAGPGATGVRIAQRVGALVLLTVSGEMKEELTIKDLMTTARYSEYGPIDFVARFENKGTVHVKPVATITITDFRGKKVAELALPQKNVLPNAIRRFEASWDKKWLWGIKYTATLSGAYGVNNIPLSSKVITFWAFPWKAGVGLLIMLAFLILTRKRWIAAFRILIKGER